MCCDEINSNLESTCSNKAADVTTHLVAEESDGLSTFQVDLEVLETVTILCNYTALMSLCTPQVPAFRLFIKAEVFNNKLFMVVIVRNSS